MTDTAFHQDETLAGLQAVGDQNAPSPQQGQPPEGALGAPASAGGTQAPPSDINGQLGAGQTYFDLWNEASDDDQLANLDEMEKQLGAHGTGVIAKTNEIASNAMAEKDGKTLNLLLKWGWKPPEERPAFDPASMGEATTNVSDTSFQGAPEADPSGKVEGALGGEAELPIVGPETEQPEVAAFSGGEPEEALGPPEGDNDAEIAHEKKMFNRRKMGGFLMELGLNILASNRDDAGGAVGEAFQQTQYDRDQRKRTAAADSLAKSERERKISREDEADLHKREKAARDEEAERRAKRKEGRDIDKAEIDKLDRIQVEGGGYEYVNRKLGTVYKKDGTYLRGVTKKDEDKLNAGQTAVGVRDAQRRHDEAIELAKAELSDRRSNASKALGKNPSEADIATYAIGLLSERDQIRLGEENYKTRDWGE